MLTGGLFSLVFALIEGNKRGWGSAFIVTFFVAAAVLLTGFVIQQARRAKPMLDVRLFRIPAFTGTQVAAFALSASIFAMFLYLTLYLQNILDYSPLQAGLRFLPISCLAFISAPISGKLSAQVPIRLLMGGGLALVAVSLWLMTGLTPTSSWTALLPGFIIGGLGIGVVNPALATSAISTVRREQAGVGSGINATFRQVGIATGIAALGAIFQHQVAASPPATRSSAPRSRSVVRLRPERHPLGRLRDRRRRLRSRVRPRARQRLHRERARGCLSALGELLADDLADRGAVGAPGDLRHHVRHHPTHVADVRRARLGDRIVDDPLEIVLGERSRHELLQDRKLRFLLQRLLLPAAGAKRLGSLAAPLPLSLQHLQLLVLGERPLQVLLGRTQAGEDQT